MQAAAERSRSRDNVSQYQDQTRTQSWFLHKKMFENNTDDRSVSLTANVGVWNRHPPAQTAAWSERDEVLQSVEAHGKSVSRVRLVAVPPPGAAAAVWESKRWKRSSRVTDWKNSFKKKEKVWSQFIQARYLRSLATLGTWRTL